MSDPCTELAAFAHDRLWHGPTIRAAAEATSGIWGSPDPAARPWGLPTATEFDPETTSTVSVNCGAATRAPRTR